MFINKNHLHHIFIFLSILVIAVTVVSGVNAQQTATSNQVITRVGDAPLDQKPGGNFVYYCQGGPPWGNTCSLGLAGCGPTSVAMIMSSLGVVMTPDQVDAVFRPPNNVWRPSCDKGSDAVSAINSTWFKGLGFTHKDSVASGSNFDYNAAKTALAEGYYILASSPNYPCANCQDATTVDHIFTIDSIDQANIISSRDPNNCNYMPGNGAENQNKRYFAPGNVHWTWNYAIPIKKTS